MRNSVKKQRKDYYESLDNIITFRGFQKLQELRPAFMECA